MAERADHVTMNGSVLVPFIELIGLEPREVVTAEVRADVIWDRAVLDRFARMDYCDPMERGVVLDLITEALYNAGWSAELSRLWDGEGCVCGTESKPVEIEMLSRPNVVVCWTCGGRSAQDPEKAQPSLSSTDEERPITPSSSTD